MDCNVSFQSAFCPATIDVNSSTWELSRWTSSIRSTSALEAADGVRGTALNFPCTFLEGVVLATEDADLAAAAAVAIPDSRVMVTWLAERGRVGVNGIVDIGGECTRCEMNC